MPTDDDLHIDDPYILVSADCHAGAPLRGYRDYLESEWHDEFDAWAATYVDPWAAIEESKYGTKAGLYSGTEVGNWDSDARTAHLDADGVVGEVIYPNTVPPFFSAGVLSATAPTDRESYEREMAGLRAHNRWLADFCAELPGRRAGIGQILLNDIDDAVNEVREIKRLGLTGGVLLPGVAPGSHLAPLHSRRYDPIWEVCAELGVPVNHHTSGSASPPVFGDEPAAILVAMMELRYWAHRALWNLMFGGAFERYADLKFVLAEQRAAWIPNVIASLEYGYGRITAEDSSERTLVAGVASSMELLNSLRRSPSEYFQRNCYVTASFMTPIEVAQRHDVGVGRLMWGSDYPHNEGTYPYSREAVQLAFSTCPVAENRQMLGETAIDLYGFDRDVLRAAAARVGPTVASVAAGLAEKPDSGCAVFDPADRALAW